MQTYLRPERIRYDLDKFLFCEFDVDLLLREINYLEE